MSKQRKSRRNINAEIIETIKREFHKSDVSITYRDITMYVYYDIKNNIYYGSTHSWENEGEFKDVITVKSDSLFKFGKEFQKVVDTYLDEERKLFQSLGAISKIDLE